MLDGIPAEDVATRKHETQPSTFAEVIPIEGAPADITPVFGNFIRWNESHIGVCGVWPIFAGLWTQSSDAVRRTTTACVTQPELAPSQPPLSSDLHEFAYLLLDGF
jgi:hypothetical protein